MIAATATVTPPVAAGPCDAAPALDPGRLGCRHAGEHAGEHSVDGR